MTLSILINHCLHWSVAHCSSTLNHLGSLAHVIHLPSLHVNPALIPRMLHFQHISIIRNTSGCFLGPFNKRMMIYYLKYFKISSGQSMIFLVHFRIEYLNLYKLTRNICVALNRLQCFFSCKLSHLI